MKRIFCDRCGIEVIESECEYISLSSSNTENHRQVREFCKTCSEYIVDVFNTKGEVKKQTVRFYEKWTERERLELFEVCRNPDPSEKIRVNKAIEIATRNTIEEIGKGDGS